VIVPICLKRGHTMMQFGQLGLNDCSLTDELAPAQPSARRWPIESVVVPPDRPVAAHGGA
jgi:hypothetical protein